MKKIKISVIVPVYNEEKYLSRCIDSILGQSLSELEVILIDDGSTDNTPMICDNYVKRDKRVKVIHKKNSGQGFSRNEGIKIASGEYISFVDSDDYLDLSMYEKMYNCTNNGQVDSVICDWHLVNEMNKISSDINNINVLKKNLYKNKEVRQEILLNVIGTKLEDKSGNDISLAVWNKIYKRKIVIDKNIKFLSEREYISEDLIFNVNFFSTSTSCYVLKEKLYYYFDKSNSFSRSYNEDLFDKSKKMYVYLMNRFKTEIDKEIILRIKKLFFNNVRMCLIQEVRFNNDTTRNKIRNIRKIISDDFIKNAFIGFPYLKCSKKYGVLYFFIKHKMVIFIYFICLVNEKRKKIHI